MRLTIKKLQLIQERITKYCSALNTDVPRVIVSEPDHELFKIQRRNEMAHGVANRPAKDPLGITYRRERVIFLATNRIKTPEELDEEIRLHVVNLTKPNYYYTQPIHKSCREKLLVGNVRNGRFFTDKKAKKTTEVAKAEEKQGVVAVK